MADLVVDSADIVGWAVDTVVDTVADFADTAVDIAAGLEAVADIGYQPSVQQQLQMRSMKTRATSQ
ncbi:MAG TPA: hypothetical protein VJB93_03575 [Patescibacteria group bacterium]|nr:hypothetical protein [Patescibacteria group bacterium]